MPESTPEYTYVEKPIIDQLISMGWQYIEGDKFDPKVTERDNFKQVLLTNRLKASIRRINLDEQGQPWLEEAQINAAASTLERIATQRLIEANQAATQLLLSGATIQGKDGKQHSVSFIDFEHLDRNEFLVINQYRVDPPWLTTNHGFIVPDLVLFVNGIPLVVIECKSPSLKNPITEAIDQLLRYTNQRNSSQPEGAEKLFHYNLIMIGASRSRAYAGSVTANHEYYIEWQDTSPLDGATIAAQLGVTELDSRQKLIAGMLHPMNLLDILRNYTLYETSGGRTIKIIPRYQQYRAVNEAIHRLQHRQTRSQHGTDDQRGGIVWHTQGAGKSLTMVYLIRKIRTIEALRRFKIVIVTDRNDLEKQLSDTATLTGEPLQKAKNVKKLEQYLREPGAGLIFGMIQKFRGGDDSEQEEQQNNMPRNLNTSEDILVLIDEAHRSHSNTLHTNLLEALPNCARIGFTGTPIVKSAKKTTLQIFGKFIDQYKIRTSQEDGVTLPIFYEGLEARVAVQQGDNLDKLFNIIFADKTEEERAQIKARYATRTQVAEAQQLINAKAKDMLHHYVARILPGGFKAQVVASTRLAAVRYHQAFLAAQQELVQKLESYQPLLQNISPDALELLDSEQRFIAQAIPHLETIRRLEFGVIISADSEDDPSWAEWTNKSKQEVRTERFKNRQDNLSFLIVKNMLLVGFNAPNEQVLYLDRGMKEYELLQAIARVNRVYDDTKKYGLVVDYYGVNLAEALQIYDTLDVESALFDITSELPKLRDQHQRLINLFTTNNCNIDDLTSCVDLLRDERLRVEFDDFFKKFIDTLDSILPRTEARYPYNYVQDAKKIGLIKKSVADLYRDEKLNIVSAKEKVRSLIDQYIESQSVNLKVQPVNIFELDLTKHVRRHQSVKAQAAEMEFAARHHINIHYDEDPVYYKNLSEKLEEIITAFEDNWSEQLNALWKYIQEVKQGRPENETGLDPRTQQPFLSILQEHSDKNLNQLAGATIEIVEHISQDLRRINWDSLVSQEDLRKWIANYLDDNDLVSYDQIEIVADKLLQLGRKNRQKLIS
ncbi:type I restriction-modification system, R subunit [Rivularia sp. IAM M-261]|nr:type I restriction-modification system, R subunit [Rivularia sp. IAM M-261]